MNLSSKTVILTSCFFIPVFLVGFAHNHLVFFQRTKSSSGLTEAELHARGALPHAGMPLTSHMMHGSVQFYPSLPVIDSEMTPPTSPAYITAQMKSLEQGSTSKLASAGAGAAGVHHGVPYTVPNNGSPITDAQAAHARLHRYVV